MVDDEDNRLRNGREKHNDSIDKRFLELFISTYILVFLKHIDQTDVI